MSGLRLAMCVLVGFPLLASAQDPGRLKSLLQKRESNAVAVRVELPWSLDGAGTRVVTHLRQAGLATELRARDEVRITGSGGPATILIEVDGRGQVWASVQSGEEKREVVTRALKALRVLTLPAEPG